MNLTRQILAAAYLFFYYANKLRNRVILRNANSQMTMKPSVSLSPLKNRHGRDAKLLSIVAMPKDPFIYSSNKELDCLFATERNFGSG
jgi:hypothetical protein